MAEMPLKEWKLRNNSVPLDSIAYGEGTFVAVGGGGVILQSGNLLNPPLQFESIATAQDGIVRLKVRAKVNSVLFIEASEDLSSWTPFASVTNSEVIREISDPRVRDFRERFFRVKLMSP